MFSSCALRSTCLASSGLLKDFSIVSDFPKLIQSTVLRVVWGASTCMGRFLKHIYFIFYFHKYFINMKYK